MAWRHLEWRTESLTSIRWRKWGSPRMQLGYTSNDEWSSSLPTHNFPHNMVSDTNKMCIESTLINCSPNRISTYIPSSRLLSPGRLRWDYRRKSSCFNLHFTHNREKKITMPGSITNNSVTKHVLTLKCNRICSLQISTDVTFPEFVTLLVSSLKLNLIFSKRSDDKCMCAHARVYDKEVCDLASVYMVYTRSVCVCVCAFAPPIVSACMHARSVTAHVRGE